jgi:carboxyl-terminal processing protease
MISREFLRLNKINKQIKELKMKKKTIKILLYSTIILLSISFISFSVFDDGDDFEIAKSFDIFHNAVREIRLFYVDDADISKLINESTEEFLQKLDPYTVYYPESKMEDFTFMTTGTYGGIGALINQREEYLLVSQVYKGSAADNVSIKVGDKIIAIDNIDINKNNISEIRELLRGEPGSEVSVKIKRYGDTQIINKTIQREKIELGNISYSCFVGDSIAYIKLDQFKQNAGKDFKNALDILNDSIELKGLIIDLRNNPGGLLHEAVNIVSLFVEKGSTVVSTRGRGEEWNNLYKAKTTPSYPNLPLTVIMNSGSASASEIVAGALQDLDRAIIIGQRSFGKGLVQITRKMNYNTRIKLTTAKYYIPSGRCIQALDYTHRNPDGSVGNIPDSLISQFKTKNGRIVFDGGGIEPDIKLKFDSLHDFTKDLIRNYIVFDFATQFYYENKLEINPSEFQISDELYARFKLFVQEKNISFKSKSGIFAEELESMAEKEKYDQSVIQKIKNLKEDLKINTLDALDQYKEEIIPFLVSEIVSRYHYDTGRHIANMNFDVELKEAIFVLNNEEKYKSYLSSPGDLN